MKLAGWPLFFLLPSAYQEEAMEAQFFTAIEISKILKISRALAYQLIAEGQIASIRFGRTVRVEEADLNEFLQRNSSKSEAQGGGGVSRCLLPGK
jgi:excisionase family DNA binding protein